MSRSWFAPGVERHPEYRRQAGALNDVRARFDFPDDFELLAEPATDCKTSPALRGRVAWHDSDGFDGTVRAPESARRWTQKWR